MNDTKKTILVVDDESDLLEIIVDELEDAGFTTLSAHGGKEAIEISKKKEIDLILSDINMPDGNGVELVDHIKERSITKPVVLFMTGFANITYEEAFDKGVEAIFPKPINFEALIETIKNLLAPPDERWPDRPRRIETEQILTLLSKETPNGSQHRLYNIGRGGAFVAMANNLPRVSDSVQLEITLDPNNPALVFKPHAIVKWVRKTESEFGPSGIGLEFDSMNREDRKLFIEYLNQIQTRSYIPIR